MPLGILAAAALLLADSAHAQAHAVRGAENPSNPCGMIYTEHYGPFDYRTQRDKVRIVEEFHFTPRVEGGIAGQSGHIGGDINYTLRASPNHHRALVTLGKVLERARAERLVGMDFPHECYYDRAIRFSPDDTVVRALYAQFLHKRKRTDEAVRQLDAGVTHAKDNAFSHYNLGLIYLEIGSYDKALAQAHRAKELGFPRTELQDQLRRLGKWRDPAPT
jgi:hypothetical protein